MPSSIFFAGYKLDLIIGDFQHIASTGIRTHHLFCCIQAVQSGGLKFGSKVIRHPETFAVSSAFFVAERTGSSVIDSVPK